MTIPSLRKEVRSPPSFSSEVAGRGPSSWVTSPSSTGTGTISLSKRPAFWAASARRWLRSAKASASRRVMPSRAASSSAVSPIDRVVAAGKRGLVNRQPSGVSYVSPGGAHGVPGLAVTQGARVIDSTPPATTRSASPALIVWAADATAVSPEAHSRLTVYPGTVWGRPASSTAIRATSRLSSPA